MTRRATKTKVALDGPSALTLYRDRAAVLSAPDTPEPAVSANRHPNEDSAELPTEADDIWTYEELGIIPDNNVDTPPFSLDEWMLADFAASGSDWSFNEDVQALLAETNVFGRGGRATASDELTNLVSSANASKRAPAQKGQPQPPQPKSDSLLPPLSPTESCSLRRCATHAADLKRIDWKWLGILPCGPHNQIHLLAPDAKTAQDIKGICERACSQRFPRRSFYLLGDTALVPSPELTLLLMSHYLELPELLMLGMELCGHYRIKSTSTPQPSEGKSVLYDQPQLTTIAKLQQLIAHTKGFSGHKRAQRCVRYLIEGAASPMESALYLLLCLPRSLGGYGMPRPILNAKRPVRGVAGALTMANHLIPDLYWASVKLDLEYDSEEFHSGLEALRRAARRTIALRLMRVEVVSVTWDLVRDPVAFEGIVRIVARRTGKRLFKPTAAVAKERAKLRAAILPGQAA